MLSYWSLYAQNFSPDPQHSTGSSSQHTGSLEQMSGETHSEDHSHTRSADGAPSSGQGSLEDHVHLPCKGHHRIVTGYHERQHYY